MMGSAPAASPMKGVLESYRNVLAALMLRDIRTRMFGSAWGFLFVIAWPLTHMGFVILFVGARGGGHPPYGDSMAIWVATGIIPFMCFSYTARFVTTAIVMNRPLLAFPIISVSQILFSRAIIELLNSSLVIICISLIFFLAGAPLVPKDAAQTGFVILAAFAMGLGFGMLNALISAMFVGWLTAFNLIIVALWLTSGIVFVPSSLPESVRNIFAYHPLVQMTEWTRMAYFDSYYSIVLDKYYLLEWCFGLVFFALLVEKTMRPFVLNR